MPKGSYMTAHYCTSVSIPQDVPSPPLMVGPLLHASHAASSHNHCSLFLYHSRTNPDRGEVHSLWSRSQALSGSCSGNPDFGASPLWLCLRHTAASFSPLKLSQYILRRNEAGCFLYNWSHCVAQCWVSSCLFYHPLGCQPRALHSHAANWGQKVKVCPSFKICHDFLLILFALYTWWCWALLEHSRLHPPQ